MFFADHAVEQHGILIQQLLNLNRRERQHGCVSAIMRAASANLDFDFRKRSFVPRSLCRRTRFALASVYH